MFQKELLDMMKADQDMRTRGRYDPTLGVTHTKRLKELIRENGWPTYDLVGEKAAFAAWLIVQHSDKDKSFQKKCFKLLTEAVEKGQASKKNLAYLCDRVRVNYGRKQLYGTQFFVNSKGEYGPRPIEDVENLEKRRKEFGLEPFADYKKYMEERHK